MARSTRHEFSSFLGAVRSAFTAAAAAEGGRPVPTRDLVRLGIDPTQFRKIERL